MLAERRLTTLKDQILLANLRYRTVFGSFPSYAKEGKCGLFAPTGAESALRHIAHERVIRPKHVIKFRVTPHVATLWILQTYGNAVGNTPAD